jgi:hypothetical protein
VKRQAITVTGASLPCAGESDNPTNIPDRERGKVRGLAALIHALIVLMWQRYKFLEFS